MTFRGLLAFTFLPAFLAAQQYTITTVAGGAPPPLPAQAGVPIGSPRAVVVDKAGNAYFTSLHSVFKLDQNGNLTKIAGIARAGFSGDGGPATAAQLSSPGGLAFDSAGNLFIADAGNNRIRRVSAAGMIVTVGGSGAAGFSGDGGPAVSAAFSAPQGVAVDSSQNVYVADTGNNRVRRIAASGVVTTFAGTGVAAASGDGAAAVSAGLSAVSVALDGLGNVYVSDALNFRIRRILPTGIITTAAGSGVQGYYGDGGAATAAQIAGAGQMTVDKFNNVYFADTGNGTIRELHVDPDYLSTVAGIGQNGYYGDGGPAISAALAYPQGVALDSDGDVIIADSANYRLRVVPPDGSIFNAAGNGSLSFSGDAGPALSAQLNNPEGLAIDTSGNIYFADTGNNVIREVSPAGTVSRVAGAGPSGFSPDGGAALSALLAGPRSIALDSAGDIFIADTINNRVREVSAKLINTVIGGGSAFYAGDGGAPLNAGISTASVALDAAGDLFIGDPVNFRVRELSADGTVSTVAGSGTRGYSGDNGPAASAQLSAVRGIAVDLSGNLYIADAGNNVVRKVSSTGTITTVAGTGAPGFSGDGGQASKAQLSSPSGVAIDSAGDLFIADTGNNRVRMVLPSGVIATIAGNGVASYSGDGGFSAAASLNAPYAVAAGRSGAVYVSDSGNNAIRLLTPNSNTMQVTAVVDAASELSGSVSPGKIVVIYGIGLGPSQLVVNTPSGGSFSQQLAGVSVSFRGVLAPIYYVSATQLAVIVPYEVAGTGSAVVEVAYLNQLSPPFSVSVAAVAPGIFTANSSGTGQAAAINVTGGVLNSATAPAKIGDYISLYLTGEGQTNPPGVDGKLATLPLPSPTVPVTATIGGVAATVQYKGAVYGAVAGLMQVNLLIPAGIAPGGYVPVVVTVGSASTPNGSIWIAVSN